MKKVSGVRALYLNSLLRGIAGSMVGIFYPAYVYLYGVEVGGMIWGIKILILTLVLERGLVAVFSMGAGKLVNKIGFKKSILLSAFLSSLWFTLPAIFPRSLILILVLSAISAVVTPIYWLTRLSILSIDGERKNYGGEVSLLFLTNQVASILGPFTGGILLITSGFGTLFAVATFISILSAIPFFFVDNYKIENGISLRGFWDWLKNKKERHLHWSFIGQGIANLVDDYFWPLYIFITIGSFAALGILTSVAMALSCVAIYLAGKIFDEQRAMGGNEDEKSYTLATFFLGLMTFFRPFLTNVWSLFSSDATFRAGLAFWGVDYEAYLYSAGKRAESPLEFYAYREVLYSISRSVWPLLLLLVPMNYLWWAVFGMGSIGTWMTVGMRKES